MTISKSIKETEEIASRIGDKVKNGGVVCLFGDLGSGKTAFTKGLAEKLGIEKFSIKSPTYTYLREYKLKDRKFYHIDLYRIEALDELLEAEIEELMNNHKNILVIEWAEKMQSILPKKRIDINLKYINKEEREIKISETA